MLTLICIVQCDKSVVIVTVHSYSLERHAEIFKGSPCYFEMVQQNNGCAYESGRWGVGKGSGEERT